MVILLEIIRLCKEKKEKVLVFSQSLKTLDLIAHFITNVYSYSRIDGSTTFQERSIKIKNFNSELDDVDVFLLSTKVFSNSIKFIYLFFLFDNKLFFFRHVAWVSI